MSDPDQNLSGLARVIAYLLDPRNRDHVIGDILEEAARPSAGGGPRRSVSMQLLRVALAEELHGWRYWMGSRGHRPRWSLAVLGVAMAWGLWIRSPAGQERGVHRYGLAAASADRPDGPQRAIRMFQRWASVVLPGGATTRSVLFGSPATLRAGTRDVVAGRFPDDHDGSVRPPAAVMTPAAWMELFGDRPFVEGVTLHIDGIDVAVTALVTPIRALAGATGTAGIWIAWTPCASREHDAWVARTAVVSEITGGCAAGARARGPVPGDHTGRSAS